MLAALPGERSRSVRRLALPIALLLTLAVSPAAAVSPSPQQSWWGALQTLCGNAYAGTLTHRNEADAALAEQAMVMHVRACSAERIEIPFHVGENRSRTWVLTRSAEGIRLQHDHRHEDGTPDAVTLYGGQTTEAGSTTAQSFPADEYSRELFTRHELPQSVTNVWTMEVVPGERFSYALRRPGRHFQVDFDLRTPVPPPPPAWGAAP
jgi:hypothetical protein